MLVLLFVAIVGDFQPMLHFVVDVLWRFEWDAMRDAILFCKAAGVNLPAFRLHVS